MKATEKRKREWLKWLESYGNAKFLESFLQNVEGAKSTCHYCRQDIYVDVLVGGGVPAWSTEDGDFGCPRSPDTNSEGTGGHMPEKKN